jgi:RNA polymerase sigma-70 factor, ECF subfamily
MENNTDGPVLRDKETELITSLRKGDGEAAARIFNLYFDRLYSMVYYSVDRDHDVAQDITQETFVSALKAAEKYKGNSNLYTWLAGIANHKIADYYRQLENERKHVPQTLLNTVSSPLGNLEDNLKEDMLSDLPFTYRQVLILKYVEDLPVLEISKIMNKSPKSIEGLLSRARNMVRGNQQKYFEG